MYYQEFEPSPAFSQHVECFWELELSPEETNKPYEVLAPDCTFDIVFCDQPLSLFFVHKNGKEKIPAGAIFIGQKTSGIYFCITRPQKVFGIRFKPFAFAHLFSVSPDQLTNKAIPLDKLFPIQESARLLIKSTIKEKEQQTKIVYAEKLILALFDDLLYIDQTFRAQLNYILARKGMLKIQDLFTTFDVSKVTLHKHFLEKMGLSPKQVSRIWRLNHFLQLQQEACHQNFTHLALEAGYYDQAHSIREFKAFFNHCPSRLFQQNSQLLKISQDIITRRFSNVYDPRV